jgi:hypothetical protein
VSAYISADCLTDILTVNKSIKPLEPPDNFHLSSAIGWLELGNHIEANDCLEESSPSLRVHPDVLSVRWQIYAKDKKWEACVDIARAITKLAPHQPGGWIHLGYSLRRSKNGGLQPAREALCKNFFGFYLNRENSLNKDFRLRQKPSINRRLCDYFGMEFAVFREWKVRKNVNKPQFSSLSRFWPE